MEGLEGRNGAKVGAGAGAGLAGAWWGCDGMHLFIGTVNHFRALAG